MMKLFCTRLLILLFIALPIIGSACPFCGLVTGSTLRSELAASTTVVLSTYEMGQYKVLAVIKGDSPVPVDESIQWADSDTHPQNSQHLLMIKKDKPEHWEYWDSCTAARLEFAQGMLTLPSVSRNLSTEKRLIRLRYFYPHLVSDDSQLLGSALEEFAASPYSVVKKLAQELDREELRSWITSNDRTSADRRFFFTLLAASRHSEDIPFVKEALDKNLNVGMSVELDAVLAAYLTLTGEAGLDELDRGLLSAASSGSRQWSPSVYRAVAEALRFHMDQETVIERQRVLESGRLLLAFTGSADDIIEDLARWEDWESLEPILELWELAEQKKWLKIPIVNYLQACPLPEAKAALPAAYQKALVVTNGPATRIEWAALRPASPGEQTMLNLTLDQEIDLKIIKQALIDGDENSQLVNEVDLRLRAQGIDARQMLKPVTTAQLLSADPYELLEPIEFWNGRRVKLEGYPEPLRAGLNAEFLLVPVKGACIELPSPPPNQVVHFSVDAAERFDPGKMITITGTLFLEKHYAPLKLKEADKPVQVAYRMKDVQVDK